MKRAGIAYRVFTSAADVNRFGARYRLASAFKGLNLGGYSDTTAQGYDALTRVTLAWSAFEALLKATGRTRHDIPALSASMDFRSASPIFEPPIRKGAFSLSSLSAWIAHAKGGGEEICGRTSGLCLDAGSRRQAYLCSRAIESERKSS